MTTTADSEERAVNAFGYPQELRRTLSWFSVFSVAFSIVSITTGIFLNFGFGIAELGPVSIWIWPIAGAGQLLIALVLSELGTRIPLAGANYQWGARLVGPVYGWFVGALGILFGAVGIPGIMYLAAAPLAEYVMGVDAPSQRLTLFIAALLITIAYLINIISVQVAARVNNVAVFAEVIGTVVLAVLLFFLWVGGYKHTDHGIGYLGHHSHVPGQPYWYAIALAALVGIYTIAGFESAADMAEEAVDAKRSVPRAMIGTVIAATVLGMIVLIGFTIAIPNDAVFAAGGLPGVFQYWIGAGLARTFIGIVVFSMFALVVVGAAANGRLLFAMARDNMLPASGLMRKVHPTTKTPIPAVSIMWALNIGVLVFGYNSANAFGTLIGASAVVPYLVYLLTVLAYGLRRRRFAESSGGFDLGRAATPVFVAAVIWIVAVILTLTLPHEFRKADYYVLGGLVLATLWWLFGLRPRLARGEAGVPSVFDAPNEGATTLPGTTPVSDPPPGGTAVATKP